MALNEEGVMIVPGIVAGGYTPRTAQGRTTLRRREGPAVILLHGGIVGSSGRPAGAT